MRICSKIVFYFVKCIEKQKEKKIPNKIRKMSEIALVFSTNPRHFNIYSLFTLKQSLCTLKLFVVMVFK